MKNYLAIDIGASSGRHIIGRVQDGKITLEEVFRFTNGQIRKDDHDCWDVDKLVELHTANLPDPTEEEIEELRRKISDRVAYYAVRMGVEPRSVKITSAKTRFGSCSPKNGLCFSTRLIPHSDAAIDYVVVHELAHIRQKNHGAAFYREIEKILPDYRDRIRLLKNEEKTK